MVAFQRGVLFIAALALFVGTILDPGYRQGTPPRAGDVLSSEKVRLYV